MPRGYMPPWTLQLLGIILLIGATVFWIESGHQSALIVGAAMALIGLGAYSGIRISITQEVQETKRKEQEKLQQESAQIARDVEDLGHTS